MKAEIRIVKRIIHNAIIRNEIHPLWIAPKTNNLKELLDHLDEMCCEFGNQILLPEEMKEIDSIIDMGWEEIDI